MFMRTLPLSKYRSAKTEDEELVRGLITIGSMQKAFSRVRREAKTISSARRKPHIDLHNRRTNVRTFNFGKVNFVLFRQGPVGGHRLRFFWQGPRQTTNVRSDHIQEVRKHLTGKVELAHARRLHLSCHRS